MTSQEMIEGKIYYLETEYKWLIRFKKIEDKDIYGYGHIPIPRDCYNDGYMNLIGAHKIIREATEEEIKLYESLEKPSYINKKEEFLMLN